MMVRERAAAVARSLDGIGANPKSSPARARFIELVAPGEKPRRGKELAALSSCALVAAGVWRSVGVEHALLRAPYVLGTAVSRLVQIGLMAGAVRRPSPELVVMPAAGDVCWVGDGGAEHVFVCIEVGLRAGAQVLWTLDGGQRDADGFQLAACREHIWRAAGARVVDVARDITPGKSWGNERAVQGWIDLEAVVARFGAKREAEARP
jgi:hypothetical protein